MKILQLTNYYYPDIGGIEKITKAISDSLCEDHEVKVVCFSHKMKSKNEMVEGVEVFRCGTLLKVASQQLAFKMVSIIKKQFRVFNPDVVIVQVPNPFLEAILMRYIKDDCRLIVHWQSDIVKQKIGAHVFSALNDRLLERADCVIATSPNYINGSKHLRKFKEKCRVIPDCIDEESLVLTESIMQKAETIRIRNKDKKICLCVGRQVPYKGFMYAIQAVNSLNDNYILYILGREGESTPGLKKLATNPERVVFKGEVDDDTLRAYMVACDIFCFPSVTKNEAFGLALAEAMYYGKPAVTFTISGSGVNYVCPNHVGGIEVPNKSVEEYKDAIKTLAESEALRMQLGKSANERVQELFLKKSFIRNIQALINNTE